jgi:hypothetical protein
MSSPRLLNADRSHNGFPTGSNKSPNDVKFVKTYEKLENMRLDLTTPRIKKAMQNLGVRAAELKPKSHFQPQQSEEV